MSLRITIQAPDAEIAEQVKERFFKDLYEHGGTKVIFEVPDHASEKAQSIAAAAKEAGCEAAIAPHKDELDDAEPVSFW